jgi:hypothetical protein
MHLQPCSWSHARAFKILYIERKGRSFRAGISSDRSEIGKRGDLKEKQGCGYDKCATGDAVGTSGNCSVHEVNVAIGIRGRYVGFTGSASNLSVRPGILLQHTLNPSPIILNRDQFDSRFAKLTTICGSSEICFFSPTRLLGRRLVVFGEMVETHSTPCPSQITQSTKLAHSLPPT